MYCVGYKTISLSVFCYGVFFVLAKRLTTATEMRFCVTKKTLMSMKTAGPQQPWVEMKKRHMEFKRILLKHLQKHSSGSIFSFLSQPYLQPDIISGWSTSRCLTLTKYFLTELTVKYQKWEYPQPDNTLLHSNCMTINKEEKHQRETEGLIRSLLLI